MRYPVDSFTPEQAAKVSPYVSNLDLPVFALVNLPETVKGALFARYSRYQGTLRHLLLNEFGDALTGDVANTQEQIGSNASELYDRIFLGYGDDSVAQLGGMHVAAEWCSNVLTKVLQRPRIGAYLEQSTRYITFDEPVAGLGEAGSAADASSYRYYRDSELIAAVPGYKPAMDQVFAIYSQLIPQMTAWCGQQFPCPEGTPPAAHERAIKAKALDLLRGLLPASTLSHVGIYASGQTYEQLVMHLLAHPLPEARQYGLWILDAVKSVMPSFVSRVERPDRGGRWIEYLQERQSAADRWSAQLGLDQATAAQQQAEHAHASVKLIEVEGNEDQLLAGLLFESTGVSETAAISAVSAMSTADRSAMLSEFMGGRDNRRHRPGRGLERLRYRFEVVSDYGAFRDLQRHRMLTVQWQSLTPLLGAEVPQEVKDAGCGDQYQRALDASADAWQQLVAAGRPREAAYAVSLGYRMRYLLDLNARAAMQLIELRSGREGHPSYRAVAHEMHSQISQVHPAVGNAMAHVDMDVEPRLERILAEIRSS